MKAYLKKISGSLDSPSLLRDLRTVLGPWRLCMWVLLLNGALLFFMGLMIYLLTGQGEEEFKALATRIGMGQYCLTVLFCTMGGIFTLLIPLRASGLYEGPRWGRYFDQIVMTGISPLRYMAGKIAAQNVFALALLVLAFPYLVFCFYCGGVSFSYLLQGLFALWVYANLLSIYTLATAIHINESVAVIKTIAFFGFIYFLGIVPAPTSISVLTPARILVYPLYAVHDSMLRMAGRTDLLHLGPFWYFMLGSAFAGLTAFALALLGPLRCLVGENGTFGEVVMKGDNKKGGMFRRRFGLRRRSELAFFFENRPLWQEKWDGPLRWGLALLWIWGLASIAYFGFFYFVSTQPNVTSIYDDFLAINLIILVISLLVALYVFSSDRTVFFQEVSFFSRKRMVGNLDGAAFLATLGFLTLMTLILPQLMKLAFTGNLPDRPIIDNYLSVTLIIVLMALESFSILRNFSMKVWSRREGFMGTFGLVMALWFIPFAVYGVLSEVYRHYYKMLEPVAAWVMALTPVSMIDLLTDNYKSAHDRRLYEIAAHETGVVVTLLLAVFFFWFASRSGKKRKAAIELRRKQFEDGTFSPEKTNGKAEKADESK